MPSNLRSTVSHNTLGTFGALTLKEPMTQTHVFRERDRGQEITPILMMYTVAASSSTSYRIRMSPACNR